MVCLFGIVVCLILSGGVAIWRFGSVQKQSGFVVAGGLRSVGMMVFLMLASGQSVYSMKTGDSSMDTEFEQLGEHCEDTWGITFGRGRLASG